MLPELRARARVLQEDTVPTSAKPDTRSLRVLSLAVLLRRVPQEEPPKCGRRDGIS